MISRCGAEQANAETSYRGTFVGVFYMGADPPAGSLLRTG